MSSTVMRISKSGKTHKNAEKAQAGDEGARIVVAEFLHHPEDEGGRAESLLSSIDSPHHLLERVHGS
jgi:hypothetical protein